MNTDGAVETSHAIDDDDHDGSFLSMKQLFQLHIRPGFFLKHQQESLSE